VGIPVKASREVTKKVKEAPSCYPATGHVQGSFAVPGPGDPLPPRHRRPLAAGHPPDTGHQTQGSPLAVFGG
jgi:hypothetical protein